MHVHNEGINNSSEQVRDKSLAYDSQFKRADSACPTALIHICSPADIPSVLPFVLQTGTSRRIKAAPPK